MSPLFEVLRRWPEAFTRPVPEGSWVDDAVRHGVAPWVVESLTLGKQRVPDRLLAASRAQLASGNRHRRFTLEVLDALARRGVVPVLLKGLGLAHRLYTAPLSRPATDVDVLVPAAQLGEAERALEALGLAYQPDDALADAFSDHHHRSWASRQGLVELHHRLASGFGGQGFRDAEVEARTVAAQLEGRPVRYLAPEDELAYLAAHAANHSFLRLSWLVDLKQFVALTRVDWGTLALRGRESSLLRPIRAALGLAERLLDARLPAEAHRAFRGFSLRAPLDRLVFSPTQVASAQWAQQQVPAFILHLYLTQTPTQVVRHVFEGAKRALRRARSRH